MANHQVLDNITHQDIKVMTHQHPDMGDTHSYASLVLSELSAAQADYAIFFRPNAQGQYELLSLLGLSEQENLYLDDAGWHAHYIPLSIRRRPFLIGFQQEDGTQQPVVHIDMDSPRVNSEQGESVFMPHGGQSGYLQEISSVLKTLHEGHNEVAAFVDCLQSYGLIESVDLSITLNNQETLNIQDLHTVNEDKLQMLDRDAIFDLHSKGYLKYVYMLIASLANITSLIERKNANLI